MYTPVGRFEGSRLAEEPGSPAPKCIDADWLARTFVLAVFLGLSVHTWAQWGDLRVDTGREMYVPAMLAHGKMLYRDVWYPYGPLAPYVQGLLFQIFGVHLVILYIAGLALTLAFALVLCELSRRFIPPAGAALVSLGYLMQAFNSGEFNYVVPYTYAAVYGSLFGVVFLYFLVRHILGEVGPNLLLSGLAAGFALLAKQECGAACWIVLAVALLGDYWTHRSLRALGRQALRCIPGLALFLIGFGWFVWRVSLWFILFRNFQVTPGSYFMRTFGAKWVADRGLRFVPSEILHTMWIALLCVGVWFSVAWAARMAISKRRVFVPVAFAVLSAGSVIAMVEFIRHSAWEGYLFWHRSKAEIFFFPIGMYWLACVFFFCGTIRYFSTRGRESLAMMVVGAYALANGIRIMVQVEPRNYSIYYDSIIFLAFVFILVNIFRRVSLGLRPVVGRSFVVGLLAVEAAGLFAVLMPGPVSSRQLPTALHTDYGTIYVPQEDAAVFPPAIAFLKEQNAQGKHVLAVPEEVSLYFFAGIEAPSFYYQISPGVLPPEAEADYIAGLERIGIDFVLVSNRSTFEYGVPYFGLDFHQKIYQWIEDNYEVSGEFGHFIRKRGGPYGLQLYRKRLDRTRPSANLISH